MAQSVLLSEFVSPLEEGCVEVDESSVEIEESETLHDVTVRTVPLA